MKHCYVYSIRVDGVVRYFGKGSGDRARRHLWRLRALMEGRGVNRNVRRSALYARLQQAASSGATIETVIVANGLTDEEAYGVERDLIGAAPPNTLWSFHLGRGPDSAGMRKALSAPEIRKRISEGTRRGLADPVVRERRRQGQLAAARDPELQARKGESMRRKWLDPVYRERQSAGFSTLETRLKMSVAAKLRPVAPDFVERMLAAQKTSYGPERRRRVLHEALSSPTVRLKIAEHSRRLWADPAYRAKQMESRRRGR